MRIAFIAAGAAGTICGNCLKDNALAAAMMELGHDVQLIPTYTPIRTDEKDVSLNRVFYGGLNVYLQEKSNFFRRSSILDPLLDRPSVLRLVSRLAVKTLPQDLGVLTVSVLEGDRGPQKKELEKLLVWLQALQPDIIQITNSMLTGIAPAVKARMGVPVVCALQGEDYFLSHLPEPYSARAFSLIREHAASVDRFVAPCRDHAERMAQSLGLDAREISVVHPGLNLEGYPIPSEPPSEPPARREFVIGYLARVAPEKGLDMLADVFIKLKAEYGMPLPCRLRVAGWLSAEHEPFLEAIGKRLCEAGLAESFEYRGVLSKEEKLRFLQSIDVLSVPVKYPASKGLYVLEAWACGVPVIQPLAGVFPELIEATGGGFLVTPGDPDQLVQAVLRVMEHPTEARQMGHRAQRCVHHQFHSRRMAEETIGLYEQLV